MSDRETAMPLDAASLHHPLSASVSTYVDWLPPGLRPLRSRLPLFTALILSGTMATMVWVAFKRNEMLVARAAAVSLDNSARQVAGMLQSSTGRLSRDMVSLASRPQIQAASSVLSPTQARSAAKALLTAERERSPQFVSLALWAHDGRLIAGAGDLTAMETVLPAFSERTTQKDAPAVVFGPLVSRGDSVMYSISAKVFGAGASAIGYVVGTRLLGSNPATPGLLSGMIGPQARLLLGNRGDDLWTDFVRPLRGVHISEDSSVHQYTGADGSSFLHSAIPLSGTPWLVAVDVPRSWATTTATRFMADMLGIAILLVLVGAILVWIVTNRSLIPLDLVTQAVVSLSHGRPVPVVIRGDDELAHLGAAFNSMSRQVQESATLLRGRAEALERSYRELQESEARYRALLDHLPDAVLVQRDDRIVFANASCARLFAVESAADLVGRSVTGFVDPDDRSAVAHRIHEAQHCGVPASTRITKLLLADGVRRTVEATSTPLALSGKAAIQTILHDVTERQLLEEQLRQSQKMDAVGRLAGGVAHDFNNILTVIDAHAEFAQREDAKEARSKDIDEIRRASATAAQLTRQLLAFSRKQAIAPEVMNLSSAIDGVTVMLRRLIGDEVTVRTDLASDLWKVRADPTHVEQVILNLAVNARDAMPKGGTLTIRTSNLTVDDDYRTATGDAIPAGDYVALTVEDTGVGMSPDVRAKVFEPFFTTKQSGQGTGLGLSTVYGIIRQSNGFIWLYSEVGHGTSFKILLPRHAGEGRPSAPTRISDHRLKAITAHVMLVEDQAAVRAALRRALQQAGFEVTEAHNAEEAQRLIEADGFVFDLLVTDMMMTGQTGADLARHPAVIERGVPVIIMSGYSEEFTSREWELPPNATFVEKPVSPRQLVQVINERLGPVER